MIGNMIGDEGAKALSEMLKVNSTLGELNLRSLEDENSKWQLRRIISIKNMHR